MCWVPSFRWRTGPSIRKSKHVCPTCHLTCPVGTAVGQRHFNWPPIISTTPKLVYLYASVESWLAVSRDSCYAERNVNRVPGGGGMWGWVTRTHADTIYYWLADSVVFFLIFSSVCRLSCCLQRWRNVLCGIDFVVRCSLTAVSAEK